MVKSAIAQTNMCRRDSAENSFRVESNFGFGFFLYENVLSALQTRNKNTTTSKTNYESPSPKKHHYKRTVKQASAVSAN